MIARIVFFFALLGAAGVSAQAGPPPNGILVVTQFDNTLDRVQNNIATVNKYLAEKLCKVPGTQVAYISGKDESSLLNHQSKVTAACWGGDVRKLVNNCGGRWNKHEYKDEIKDHTTPDIEVQEVISCTPSYIPPPGGRKLLRF